LSYYIAKHGLRTSFRMATGFLQISGNKIVDEAGRLVILRGAGLGGWINMENFITGCPGHECEPREAMRTVLGDVKYEFFFDKFLEYFFTEGDAKFFASLGLNCPRFPFNYRHLEDDMNPRVLKAEGFKHLDRVIDLIRDQYPSHNYYHRYIDGVSMPNTTSTQSWTCTPSPAAKTPTDAVTEQAERVQYRLLEKTTKLQKEEKNHEVGSRYHLQQAVRNTAKQ
jgi:hypothetical protein